MGKAWVEVQVPCSESSDKNHAEGRFGPEEFLDEGGGTAIRKREIRNNQVEVTHLGVPALSRAADAGTGADLTYSEPSDCRAHQRENRRFIVNNEDVAAGRRHSAFIG